MIRILKTGLIILSLLIYPVQAQESGKAELRYRENGNYKIVQFTDMHYYPGGAKSPQVMENLRVVLDAEQPDLVVLTGDIVTCSGKLCPTFESWDSIAAVFEQRGLPWAVTFGNHDDEASVSREELLNYLEKKPGCLIADMEHTAGLAAAETSVESEELAQESEELAGTGNFMLPLYNKKGKAEKLLYFMDSNAYSTEKKKGVRGYGWFDRSQIAWFASVNESWLASYPGSGALIFYHIPLPEYKEAFDKGSFRIGVRQEKECAPDINTGFFAEQLLQGNVLGNFVGHDHDNNYAAQLYGIPLVYGAFSGGNVYFNLRINGARVIELNEGKDHYRTWLRYRDGSTEYEVTLPVK